MKILVAGWDSGGGVEAVQTVVGRAVARGHQVRVLGTEGLRSRFESAGATFLRYKYAPDNDLRQPETDLVKDWQTRNPLSQWQRVRDRQLCGPAREFCRDVAEELQREAADVAVVDTMIPAAMFGAEVTGIRAVIVMHGPYMIPRPDVPPLGTGLMPAKGPLGRLRDRSAAAVALAVFRSGMPSLNRTRAEVGLPPVRDLPGLMARADRILVCSSPGYDFASRSVPANVRYVGPQLDDEPSSASGDRWPAEPGQPLSSDHPRRSRHRDEGLDRQRTGQQPRRCRAGTGSRPRTGEGSSHTRESEQRIAERRVRPWPGSILLISCTFKTSPPESRPVFSCLSSDLVTATSKPMVSGMTGLPHDRINVHVRREYTASRPATRNGVAHRLSRTRVAEQPTR